MTTTSVAVSDFRMLPPIRFNTVGPGFSWRPRLQHTTFWQGTAQERVLHEIADLQPDWDAAGAAPIDKNAVLNALQWLWSFDKRLPEFIFPNPAGTIEFEWCGQFGTAHLEIGNSTFGFYTSPTVGEPVMAGGSNEDANVEKIRLTVETIYAGSDFPSLAGWNRVMGVPAWYTERAA